MGGFDVELAALPEAKAEADRVHGQLQNALGDVNRQVTSLLGGGWTGPAASSFQNAFDDWRGGAEDVLRALATISQLIVATERDYAASDEVSANLLKRLGG